MPGPRQCNSYCRYKDFAIKLLYNISVYRYWKGQRNKHVLVRNTKPDGTPKLAKRYTAKHKALGLARCKLCEYITALPTLPGTRCPCCNNKLTRKINSVTADKSNKDQTLSKHEMVHTIEEIQEQAKCNWCMTYLRNQFDKITEANFIATGKKFSNGEEAFAVYCNECLTFESRVKQPKGVINKNTLDEINIENLPSTVNEDIGKAENKSEAAKSQSQSQSQSESKAKVKGISGN